MVGARLAGGTRSTRTRSARGCARRSRTTTADTTARTSPASGSRQTSPSMRTTAAATATRAPRRAKAPALRTALPGSARARMAGSTSTPGSASSSTARTKTAAPRAPSGRSGVPTSIPMRRPTATGTRWVTRRWMPRTRSTAHGGAIRTCSSRVRTGRSLKAPAAAVWSSSTRTARACIKSSSTTAPRRGRSSKPARG